MSRRNKRTATTAAAAATTISPEISPTRGPSSSSSASSSAPAEIHLSTDPDVAETGVAPPLEKKRRVMSDDDDVDEPDDSQPSAPQALVEVKTNTQSLQKLLQPISGVSRLTTALLASTENKDSIDTLLVPLPPKVQDKVSTMLINWWQDDPTYFAQSSWMTSLVTPKVVNPKSPKIKYKTLCMTPLQPTFRSPFWVDCNSMTVTEKALKASAARFAANNTKKDDEKGDDSHKHYIKIMVLQGDDYISQEECKYYDWLDKVIVSGMVLFMGRAEAEWRPKQALLPRLLHDEEMRYTGKYKKLTDVPLDDPDLIHAKTDWLSKGYMKVMHDYFHLTQVARMVVYTGKADSYVGDILVPFGGIIPVFCVFVSKHTGMVETQRVTDDETIERLRTSCPFTVEHSISASFVQEKKSENEYSCKYNVNLPPKKVYFFPQLSFLMKLRDMTSSKNTSANQCDNELANELAELYGNATSKTQLALTHEQQPAQPPAVAVPGQFANYRAS